MPSSPGCFTLLAVEQHSQGSWSPWPSDVVCGGSHCSDHPCACSPLPSFGAQGLVGAGWEPWQPPGRGCLGSRQRRGRV